MIMKEYIEREAAIEAVLGLTIVDPAVAAYANAVYFILHDLPAADVVPVRHGKWIDSSNGWMCSECEVDNTYDKHYCPNCGALMDKKEDDNNE